MQVAEFAVAAFVEGVDSDERSQLRRKGWEQIASQADRRLLAELRSAQVVAAEEERTAEDSLEEARRLTERVEFFRGQLERMIGEREAADRAAGAARRAALAAGPPATAPRYARTTRGQAELFARYGDFYMIDPLLFSPAEVTFVNVRTGRARAFGAVDGGLLRKSFLGE